MWFSSTLSGLAAVAKVNIEDDFFSPASSSIHAGDSVVWTWVGTDGHNVTSTSKTPAWKATPTSEPPFSFTNTFPTAGSFPYECSIHVDEGMVGSIAVAAATRTPPTVTITTPATGASFAAPATVTIDATTTDSSGTVNDVQFFLNSTLISDSTSAPFQAVANNVAAGNYTIMAIATDSNNLKATNSVQIQVLSAPTVTITAPASGALFAAPATVTIDATTTDSSGTVNDVQFFLGSTLISDSTSVPFQAVANNVAAGNYTLMAIATDSNNLKATNSVNVQVFTPVSLESAALNSFTSFQFSYSADIGSSYVVQRSTDLISWVSLVTNSATDNPEMFSDTNATNEPAFYRVELLPNP